MENFEKKLKLERPVEELFAWHERPGAFERLLAPWDPVTYCDKKGGIQDGDWLKIKLGPVIWLARHQGYQKNKSFTDIQVRGPFAYWRHQHLFRSLGGSESELCDRITFQLPWGLAKGPAMAYVKQHLERMFAYRHRVTVSDLMTHHQYLGGEKPMKILLTGASGLIGQSLSAFLSTGGHEVVHLVRHRSPQKNQLAWLPSENYIDVDALEGFDAVIHLAGESLSGGLWSAQKKRRILDSRVNGTRLLVNALKGLKKRPRVFISASAIGYYGNSGQAMISETAGAGTGFLAEVCQAWESELEPLQDSDIRTVSARIGIVLSLNGGALAAMLPAFKLGLGSRLGSGQQYMSWIALDDIIRAFYHCIFTNLQGPVNFTAPESVKNMDFTRILASSLNRPGFFTVPEFALKLGMGEMAEEMLLGSTKVYPEKLLKSGFQFNYPDLKPALSHLLGTR